MLQTPIFIKNKPYNSGVSTQLDLDGSRKRSLSGWMAQATQFYKNARANKEILPALANFGITKQWSLLCRQDVSIWHGSPFV
ncbi:MAG: hypothetical protein AAF171_07070 [Cyanobacteria bacterium P01_A01_bin.116]